MEKQRAMNGSLKKLKVNLHIFHILLVYFSLLNVIEEVAFTSYSYLKLLLL